MRGLAARRLRGALNNCEAGIIGAGYVYTGAGFEKYFKDFAAKYKFSGMYSDGFCNFESAGEFWAYWMKNF